jgi:hypothetical protein
MSPNAGGGGGSCVVSVDVSRARIFKLLRSPRIDSKESITPAYVAQRTGATTLAQPHRLFKYSSTAVHGSPNKLWRSNSIFNLGMCMSLHNDFKSGEIRQQTISFSCDSFFVLTVSDLHIKMSQSACTTTSIGITNTF